jgi:hypothetical protein
VTAGDELAKILGFLGVPQGSGDLARYIHLDATGKEHLLYATGLGDEIVLGLALADETPFSTSRMRTKELVKHLCNSVEAAQITVS